jgi:hypothetical protein
MILMKLNYSRFDNQRAKEIEMNHQMKQSQTTMTKADCYAAQSATAQHDKHMKSNKG